MNKFLAKNNLKESYIVYGVNNCIAVLNSDIKLEIKYIYLDKSSKIFKSNKFDSYLSDKKYSIKYLDTKNFKKLFLNKHSQGIAIEFSYDFYNDIFLKNEFSKNECLLMLDQVSDPQNFGQIIRTAECAGINGIVIPKNNSVKVTNTVLQVSQGGFLNIPIYMQINLKSTIEFLKSKGFWVVGVENGVDAKQWYELDYSGKIVFVLGSEGQGIRQLIKKNCDFLATIKMNGHIDSLNVTAATSIILFERQRQLSN